MFLALRFLIGGWAAKVWAVACRYPLQVALVMSLAGNVWLWRARADCIAGQRQIVQAQKQAGADQATVNNEPARKSAEIARQSDHEAPAYYRAVANAADAHRVRATSCAPGIADLPKANRASQVNDSTVTAADMVSRSRADDDLIIAAAGRAAQMHADALSLIEAGVAIPTPDKDDRPSK